MARVKAERDDRERIKIARLLLTESMRRLRALRTLERQHGVCHPEGTCIIRDCLRLSEIVFPGTSSKDRNDGEQEVEAAPVKLSARAVALGRLVSKSSATRIGRLVGVDAKQVQAWASAGEAPDEDTREVMASTLRIDAAAWQS